jgi:glycosyltransferase involved in cell wall biosynthesis
MLSTIVHNYGVWVPGSVIPNGRSFTGPALVEKEPFVFCATRVWDEAKNVATLAKAADGLAWPVFVAGEAKAPGSVAEPRLDPVKLLGSLGHAEVMGWMARAAIFALPALYEPFGLAPLEAAGAGAALVLGDIPSLREIWGDAAVLVPPGDAPALRRALIDLAENEERRRLLAERALARALSLSSSRMAEQYLRVYNELGGARRPVNARPRARTV